MNARIDFDSFAAIAAHKWALRDLREYAADDAIDAERLAPVLAAKDMPALIAARGCLETYLGNSMVDELHSALVALAESADPENKRRAREYWASVRATE